MQQDEKNQYMTANVWLVLEWVDPMLSWKPEEYDGVSVIYVPAANIWHPDIVLYNTYVYLFTSAWYRVRVYQQ
jgi:Neurotransmitter-gated ion-channel ligand binding domain